MWHLRGLAEPGYQWWSGIGEAGLAGLCDRSRAPRRHPNQTPEEIEAGGAGVAAGAHALGAAQAEAGAGARRSPPRAWPAASTIGAMLEREGLSDRAQAAAQVRALQPSRSPQRRTPNRVWCADFKGWFRTQRWRAHRSADHQRCAQPLSAALPGGGEDRHGAGAGHLRGGVSRVRDAAGDPQRQWGAVRLAGDCRAVAAGGVVDEAGHCAGAHCGRASGAERTARAHAPHAEGRRRPSPPAANRRAQQRSVRSLPPRVQRAATAPGAGACRPRPQCTCLAACVSGAGAGAGVRQRLQVRQSAAVRQIHLGQRGCVSQRGVAGRDVSACCRSRMATLSSTLRSFRLHVSTVVACGLRRCPSRTTGPAQRRKNSEGARQGKGTHPLPLHPIP